MYTSCDYAYTHACGWPVLSMVMECAPRLPVRLWSEFKNELRSDAFPENAINLSEICTHDSLDTRPVFYVLTTQPRPASRTNYLVDVNAILSQ